MHTPPLKLSPDEIRLWWLPYQRAMGRGPLRAVLARYVGIAAAELRFRDDAHGKPRLAHAGAWLDFNWSHSGVAACIAVARGLPQLGVDIERRHTRPRATQLARRFFAREEAAWVEAGSDDEVRGERFLQLWTAKEALLKADGRGLAYGLDRVRFHVDGDAIRPAVLLGAIGQGAGWEVRSIGAPPGYLGAIAWQGAARRLVWEHHPAAGTFPGEAGL